MEPNERKKLCFVSWNVCGLESKINSIPKFDYVTEELSRQGAEIVFLQETHIGHKNYRTLSEVAGWKCYFTVYDSLSKGVAFLIKDDVHFQYLCHDEDYSGGYLVLFCHLHDQLFTLVNVYNHKDEKDILNRLQDYLKETAEGVLVVGGDFNTVVDLSFDRNSTAETPKQTPQWDIFKEFTDSLNLMDTWVYCKPKAKEFTYSQNESSSRLDMFLVPEDMLERVNNVKICKSNRIQNNANERNISDHEPLVLSLTLSKQPSNYMPNIASWLEEHAYSRDERTGKINGAEILSVIKSLTDSGQQYCDGISLQQYKKFCCPISEILKVSFNHLLKCKDIPEHFKEHTSSTGSRKIFNVDYVIFTMILAKRLKMLLMAFPEKKRQQNMSDCYSVEFLDKPKQIRLTFLKKCFTDLCKTCKSNKEIHQRDFTILEGLVHGVLDLTEDFSILESILPKSCNPSDDLRELQEGCPLTKVILSLVLKYLEIRINDNKGYITNICYYRQVIVIRSIVAETSPVLSLLRRFSEDSGIKMGISKIN